MKNTDRNFPYKGEKKVYLPVVFNYFNIMQSLFDSLVTKHPDYFQERIWASRKGMDFPFPSTIRKNAEKSLSISVVTTISTNQALILDQFKAYGIPSDILGSIKTCLKEWFTHNDVGSTKLLSELLNYYPTCVLLSVAVKQKLIDISKGKMKKVRNIDIYRTIMQTYDTFLQGVIEMHHNSTISNNTSLALGDFSLEKSSQDRTEVFFAEPSSNVFTFIEG